MGCILMSRVIEFYFVISCIFTACILSSCTGSVVPQKQSIKAVYAIEVKDPWLHQLTTITRKASIEASGVFKGGNYQFNGMPLTVQEGTSFKFTLLSLWIILIL